MTNHKISTALECPTHYRVSFNFAFCGTFVKHGTYVLDSVKIWIELIKTYTIIVLPYYKPIKAFNSKGFEIQKLILSIYAVTNSLISQLYEHEQRNNDMGYATSERNSFPMSKTTKITAPPLNIQHDQHGLYTKNKRRLHSLVFAIANSAHSCNAKRILNRTQSYTILGGL